MAIELSLTSSAFRSGSPIPREFTCEGANISPPLMWTGVPRDARTLALVVDDPDAPRKAFVHWVLFNIPTDQNILPAALNPEAHFEDSVFTPVQGVNDFGDNRYGGPCPPPGDGTHHYYFRLYALDTRLDLSTGVTKHQLTQAMNGHILAEANLIGTYER